METGTVQDKKERKQKQRKACIPTKSMLHVRILAGIYLVYLVVCMYRNYGSTADSERAVILTAMAAFLIIGVLLTGVSAYALKCGRYAACSNRDSGRGQSPIGK